MAQPVAALLRYLTTASAIALGALILHAGSPGDPGWWLLGVPFSAWIISPAVLPWLLARRTRQPWFGVVMLGFAVVSAAVAGAAYFNAFAVSKSSTAALVMVFVPLYQLVALAAVLAACAVFGWRPLAAAPPTR